MDKRRRQESLPLLPLCFVWWMVSKRFDECVNANEGVTLWSSSPAAEASFSGKWCKVDAKEACWIVPQSTSSCSRWPQKSHRLDTVAFFFGWFENEIIHWTWRKKSRRPMKERLEKRDRLVVSKKKRRPMRACSAWSTFMRQVIIGCCLRRWRRLRRRINQVGISVRGKEVNRINQQDDELCI